MIFMEVQEVHRGTGGGGGEGPGGAAREGRGKGREQRRKREKGKRVELKEETNHDVNKIKPTGKKH